jgi:hemoglobin
VYSFLIKITQSKTKSLKTKTMKKLKFMLMGSAMVAASMLLVNCTKTDTVTTPGTNTTSTVTANPYAGSIFSNEGGYAGIDSLNTHFVANVVADNTINTIFGASFGSNTNGSNEYNFVSSLYSFLVTATGGPDIYDGPNASAGLGASMVTVHTGMNITTAQFDALAGDLENAMHTCKWSKADSTGLIGAAASLAPDVIGH